MNVAEPLSPAEFQTVFQSSPEALFVLRAEPPYPIVAASDAFLRTTMTTRDAVLGRALFEAFPANPADPASNNMPEVLALLARIRQSGETEHLKPYRYDIPKPVQTGGGFEERFWQMSFSPALAQGEAHPTYFLARTEDITEKIRTEEAMADARTRLEATLAAAEIGTWIWDVESNRVFPDRNLAKFFGVSGTDAVEAPLEVFLQAIHEEDRGRVTEAIDRAVADGFPFEAEYRLVHPTLPERWVVARGRPERDEQGRTRRFPGVIVDITSRRNTEEALRDSSERLRMAIESARIGTWDYFPLTGELIWSELCNAMFGLPPGSPTSLDLFMRAVHAEDKAATQAAMDHAFDPASGGYFEVDYRAVGLEDHVERWIAARGRALFDEHNHVERFIGTTVDVTARKRAEQAALRRNEQLQQLTAASTRLNAAHDVRSVLGVVTGEARNLIGTRHAVITAVPADQPHMAAQKLTVSSSHTGEVPIGDGRPPSLTVPLHGHGGRPIGSIELLDKMDGEFSADDGVMLAQLAQVAAGAIENARLYEELRANDKRKDEFLAMLAHELRNPLAAIRNAVALSGDDADAADVAWSMEVIQRQVVQLSRLIDDLLDVSRITQGMTQLRKESINLSEVIKRATETVQGLVAERRHSLEIFLPPEPLMMDGDPVRLEQIFVNLLTNAAKYTEQGGELSVRAVRDDGHVLVRVRDNGTGIPADKLPQMFELFAQGSRSLARSEGGLGIGLTIVRSLTHMHGGTIQASSEGLGKGSEFVVRLPATVPEASTVSPTPAAAPTPPVAEKVRVLVVDDNVDSARATAKILTRNKYDVQVAYDGPTAVETALSHQPKYVFLDIGLPGLNGYEVAARLRQEPNLKDAMLVAVSGYGEEGDRRRSREAGFDQHLVKPVDPDVLLALMRS